MDAAQQAQTGPASGAGGLDEPAQSAEPVIREPAPDPTAVVLAWNDSAEDGELRALHLAMRNTLPQPLAFELGLLALAPTERSQSAVIDRVELGAHETRVLELPLDAVPVQSIGLPTQLMAIADYAVEGHRGSAATMPLHVAFREDYAALRVVADGSVLARIPAGNPAQDTLRMLADAFGTAPVGRYRGADGEFHDLAASDTEGVSFGARGVALGDLDSFDAVRASAPRTPGAIEAEQPGGLVDKATRNAKVCFDWAALFVDRNLGEDYLTGGTTLFEAVYNDSAYAEYFLADATDGVIVSPASGKLSGTGCTPTFSLTVGHRFVFVTVTRLLGPNNVNFGIRDTSAIPDYRWYAGEFTLSTSTPTTVNLSSTIDTGTNTAAVATRMYQMTPDAPPASGYFVFTQEGCLGNPDDASACAQGISVYLGTNSDGSSVALWKYVIAHEIGHVVQSRLTGSWQFSYDAAGQPALCGCKHVADSRNRAHCLNSAEFNGAAMGEGFAHFWAARLFNSATQSDCTFVYYKEFPIPGFGVTVPPPIALGCAGPVRWYENYCNQIAGQGTEFDWLGFYWNLNTAPTRLTLTDIANLYKRACGGGTCAGKPAPTPALLRLAAWGEFGMNSSKDQHLTQALNSYGVNH